MNEALAAETPLGVTLTRQYSASPEQVWQAWTKPEVLAQWFWSDMDMTILEIKADARVGGKYRFHGRGNTSGNEYAIGGKYRTVSPPWQLAFTWAWETDDQLGAETLVTVDIEATPEGTQLTLTHVGFADAEQASKHNGGWTACLAGLGVHLAAAKENA